MDQQKIEQPTRTPGVKTSSKNYLELFFEYKWLIFLCCLFFTTLGVIAGLIIPPAYRASADMYINMEPATRLYRTIGASRLQPQHINTLVTTITSRSIMIKIAEQLKADGMVHKMMTTEQLTAKLKRNIKVRRSKEMIIQVTGESKDPAFAANAANKTCEVFIKNYQNAQIKEAREKVEFLSKNKAEIEEKMRNKERELEQLKEERYKILSPETSEKISEILGEDVPEGAEVLRYTDYRANLVKLKLQLKTLKAKREELAEELDGISQYQSVDTIEDKMLRELQKKLVSKKLALDKALMEYTEEYYKVKILKVEIAQLDKAIKEQRRRKDNKEQDQKDQTLLNPKYTKLKKQLDNTDNKIDQANTAIKVAELYLSEYGQAKKESTIKKVELKRLGREYALLSNRNKNVNLDLEKAESVLDLEMRSKGSNIWLAEPARIPRKPFKPKKDMLVLGGLFFGLFVGCSAVYLIDITDQTFSNLEELKSFIRIPVLGVTSRLISPFEMGLINKKRSLVFTVLSVAAIVGFIAVFLLVVVIKMRFL